MTLLEALLDEMSQQGVDVYEHPMSSGIKGLYCDRVVWLNRNISTELEKTCVLAEELGHYHTSAGDILDQHQLTCVRQEKKARNWGYEKLIPLKRFIDAYKAGIANRYELACFLDVTEEFLEKAIDHYKEKYGLCTQWTSYLIYFDPLGVLKVFEE